MKIDLSDPLNIQTRSGQEVSLLPVRGSNGCIIGAIRIGNVWSPMTWSGTGQAPCGNQHYDLVMKPRRYVRYLNVYKDRLGNPLLPNQSHSSREEADKSSNYEARIACLRLDFEEGQLDE